LAALGLVLTYKTSGIFNFAIGAQAAASAYVFYTLRVTERLPWAVAALCSLVGVGLAGSLLLERVAFWLADAAAVMRVVAAIGILVLLQSALTGAYGQQTIEFAQFLPGGGFRLGGVQVFWSQVIVVGVALGATVGLGLFFRRARLGVAMQAVVDNPVLLGLQATSPVRVRRWAWAIGSSFVSVSGMLLAPKLGIDVNLMLLLYIAAFGAAAVASFTSLPLTFGTALGIGIVMNVASYKLAARSNLVVAELYTQVPFLVLVMALLLVPRARLVERGMGRVRRLRPIKAFPLRVTAPLGSAAVVLAAALPHLVASSDINQYATGLGFAIIFGSLGLLVWTSGQISLCQMAFAAVGATTFAHLQSSGVPWIIALLLAGGVALAVGGLVSIPSFRLSGVYLAVATFGFGLLFQNLVYKTFLMFGSTGTVRVTRPHLLGLRTFTAMGYYYTCLAVALVCVALIVLVRRSRLGRLLRGLSDSPVALDAHGANTRLTRLLVFCISAFLAGLGGALLAGVTQSAGGVASGPFGYFNSVALVAVLAFCGRRAVLSPVIAAFLFEVLKVYKPFSGSFSLKYEGVFFGILAVGVAVVPGITGLRPGRRAAERQGSSRVATRAELQSAREAWA
jgi:branched-subunit amino acid ABC-type transport system permease component